MKKNRVGEGKVCLIAGGGKVYADIAARFCHSNKNLDDIIASSYNKNIVKNIVNAGHYAALEFDTFIFGIEGYSRVTEVQLVRKRIASYMISSGRDNRNGKRLFEVTLPNDRKLDDLHGSIEVDTTNISLIDSSGNDMAIFAGSTGLRARVSVDANELLNLMESFYNNAVEAGIAEEDARYYKPQATTFKAIVAMNAHALRDWFKIRCCKNAQAEISDMAWKMLKLCKEAAPDLFENAGPSCVALGFCPENNRQNPACKAAGKITLDRLKEFIQKYN
jgi:thymidylate synthase (FAD)